MAQSIGREASVQRLLEGHQRSLQNRDRGEIVDLSQIHANEVTDGRSVHVRNTPSGALANMLSPPQPNALPSSGGVRSPHQLAKATARTKSSCWPSRQTPNVSLA